jgi:hypothetical protein
MMMKVNILLALVLQTATTLSFSAEWDQIIKTDQYYIEVDIDTYATIDQLPTITTRTVYKTPQKMPNQSGVVYYKKLRTVQCDCNRDKIKDIEVKFLDAYNHTIRRDISSVFKAVNTDNHNREIASLVCQVHKMLGGN